MLLSKLAFNISSISCFSSSSFFVNSIGSLSKFWSCTIYWPRSSMYGFIFWIIKGRVLGSLLNRSYISLSSSSLACLNMYVLPVSLSATTSAFFVINYSSTIFTILPFVSGCNQKSALSSSCLRALSVSLRYSGQLSYEFQKFAYCSKWFFECTRYGASNSSS